MENCGKRIFSCSNQKNCQLYSRSLFDEHANLLPIQPRFWAIQYLKKFAQRVQKNVSSDAVLVGAITDTHIKFNNSHSFYGFNGLQHINEFLQLSDFLPLDVLIHLGDIIDGSDQTVLDKNMLDLATRSFANQDTPYLLAKGNHDDHDKYDEHTWSHKATFAEDTFAELVWQKMYQQENIQYLSQKYGVGYFDRDDVRILLVNTSDVPHLLNSRGQKQHDHKLVMGFRQGQLQEIIQILEQSNDKHVVVFGHGNLLKKNGKSALQHNGKALHDLLKAFNLGLSGNLRRHEKDANFDLDLRFNFKNNQHGKVLAYICGHRHVEEQFRVDNIQYILLNVSALMGKKHGLTTKYNRAWDRRKDTSTEFAGYVIAIDAKQNSLTVFGYGAANRQRKFKI